MIYIVNKHNQPLMPTNRHSHIRKLLKQGKAVVINTKPFVVKLKYETQDITQNLYCGIDTGRENIGIGVSNEKGECVFLGHLETKNKSIKIKMDDRRKQRRERRLHKRQRKQRKALRLNQTVHSNQQTEWKNKTVNSVSIKVKTEFVEHKVIKGKEAKFDNRKRKEGWLTPSGQQLIWCHKTLFNKVCEFLPITHLTLEAVSFDFQKIENPEIKDWNHGPLFGFSNPKEYIIFNQQGKCALCNNPIEHIHHIKPKSEGGSNSVSNLIGLCQHCHNEIHKESMSLDGYKQKYKVSLLNSVMPKLLEEFVYECEKVNVNLNICNGYDTFLTREKFKLNKDHSIDGFAVSLFGRNVSPVIDEKTYELRRFKKKSNNKINKLGQREYYSNGKLVAINRHKAMTQKDDSLEDFLKKNSHAQVTVKAAKRIYTLEKSNFHVGDIVKYEKHNKINKKVKIDTFVVLSVDNTNRSLYYTNTKNRRMKYCHRIKSGAIQFI